MAGAYQGPDGDFPCHGARARIFARFEREFEEWLDTPIYQRAVLAAGQRVPGPAVIEEVDSTTVVPPGWTAEVHASGCLVLHA